jgi:hypothetical protein
MFVTVPEETTFKGVPAAPAGSLGSRRPPRQRSPARLYSLFEDGQAAVSRIFRRRASQTQPAAV